MEKRVYQRLNVQIPAAGKVGAARSFEIMVVNLGAQGICFLRKETLKNGQPVELKLPLGPDREARLNTQVVWVEKVENVGCKVGVSFEELKVEEEIKYIQFYCDQLLALGAQRKKILIVDDEKAMVSLLQIELERKNYDVIVAFDGVEGYSKYFEEQPDLIILDLMLPKMNGLGVCRKIRWEQNDTRTPILMLTAQREDADRIIGRVIGSEKYITKPFEIDFLLHEVEALLNQKMDDKGGD